MELKFQGAAAGHAFKTLESKLQERREIGEEFRRASREEPPLPLEAERAEFARKYIAPLGDAVGPILAEVQSFLAASGIISSILWPSPRRFRDESKAAVEQRVGRGLELRKLLGIPDDSLLNARTGGEGDARGALLHFDEMIDDFAHNLHGQTFVSFDIGSESQGTAAQRRQAVRWLDEDTLELWVNYRKVNLRAIKGELERILGRFDQKAMVEFVTGKDPSQRVASFGMSYGTDVR